MTDAKRVEPYSEAEIATIRKVADLDDAVVEVKHFLATLDALSSRLAVVERERDEARRVKYEPRVGDVVEIADEDLECVVASVGDDSCHLWRIVDGQFSRCFVMRAARFVRAATLDELIGAKSRMQLRPSLEPKP